MFLFYFILFYFILCGMYLCDLHSKTFPVLAIEVVTELLKVILVHLSLSLSLSLFP